MRPTIRRVLVGSAVFATVVGTVGCGADADAPPSDEPAEPRQLEIADVQIHSGEPDYLLEAFGSLWVAKADGDVLQLDPATGDLIATHDSQWHETPAREGIGYDETSVWVCSGTENLARIDSTSGEVTLVKVSKRSDQGRLAFSGGLLWYIESGSTDLVGLDGSGTKAASVPLGEACTDTAYDETTVWVICPGSDSVQKVDAVAHEVVGTIEVNNPTRAAAGDFLFVGSGGGMVQVDPETSEVVHEYDEVGPGLSGGILVHEGVAWVRREGGPFLVGVDAETHEVGATLEAPDYPAGGDVVVTEDWIWATAYDDGAILQISP